MATSAFEKNIGGEYSCTLSARFRERGGRLFLVDYSKRCAASALTSLFGEGTYGSFLLLVSNPEVAATFKTVLAPLFSDLAVIDSESALNGALGNCGRTAGELRSHAERLAQSKPHLIVVKAAGGKEIFNMPLAADDAKSGVYGGESCGKLLFSDLLAEGNYEFVAVDDVHSYLLLEEADREHRVAHPAAAYERLDFLGKNYYTPISSSLKRLKQLTTGAKGVVVMSDTVLEKNAVELFAVLELLDTRFSARRVKEIVKPVADHFSFDGASGYGGACDIIYNAVTYGRDEESILSACLQRTKGIAQRVPGDINTMRDYLTEAIDYLSFEEVFLMVMHTRMTDKQSTRCPSIDTVINNMLNSYDEMAACFADMFFNNPVKGELERAVSTPYVLDMSAKEMSAVLSVFLKYGAYHYMNNAPERLGVIRLKRDDSGFEYFARRYAKNEIEDARCFSVLGEGSDDVCKCVELKRLADGKDADASVTSPLVIVTDRDPASLQSQVKSALTGYTMLPGIDAIKHGAGAEAVLMSVKQFRETPYSAELGSVVFFDAVADVVLAKRLIAKAQEVTKGKVFLLASYGNMDGVLADEWQVELKADDRMLPFASSEISLKHGARYDYADVVDRIDRIYGDLLVTVTNGTQERVKELPGAINNLLVSFATRATFDPEMMALDLEYTAKLGKYFDGVFRNTASVGNHGEHFVVRATDYAPAVGGKVPVPKTLGESVGVFFNTCAKMLRHECDIIHNNCADCADYQKFLANRFDELESSMKEFFEMADHYVAKARDLRYQIQHDDIIIGHGDDEDDVGLSAELIKSHQTAAVNALRQLQGRQAGASKVFHAEYSHVLAIREAVYQVLRKVLRKYYKAVMMVFADSTALAKSGLVGAREAVRALDRT